MTLKYLLALVLMGTLAACQAPDTESEEDEEAHESAPATQTRIPTAVAEDAGIRIVVAGPGKIADAHEVQGLMTPIEGKHARVVARFPGAVRRVHVSA